MTGLRLEVLTLQGRILDQDVDAVIVPLADGWKGVLPGHAPFEARVLRGETVIRMQNQPRTLATLGGVLRVERDRATLLAGVAVLDRTLPELEEDIRGELESGAALEAEAEKHFDRVYQQLAHALWRPSRGRQRP